MESISAIQAFNAVLNIAAVIWLVRVENSLTKIKTLIEYHGLDIHTVNERRHRPKREKEID